MKFKTFKISFCTVCMNRLFHLKETVLKNIRDNRDYGNLEFVLLDYNSTDGMEEWVKTTLAEEINSGLVVYYKTTDPKHFDRSHSRNMMFKLASGDIICNVDADNFIGEGFAKYINEKFNKNPNAILLPDLNGKLYFIRDAVGRFCSYKEDFIKVTGYDEKMSGYGFEDNDFYNRLKKLGRKEEIIEDINFLHAIKHDDEERVKNEFVYKNLKGFYIRYITADKSEVLFLYKNNRFDKGIVVPNKSYSPTAVAIEDYLWESGEWKTSEDFILLKNTEGKNIKLKKTSNGKKLELKSEVFYKIVNEDFINLLSIQLPMITNQGKYMLNLKSKGFKVNKKTFGKGTVYKNFNNKQPLEV